MAIHKKNLTTASQTAEHVADEESDRPPYSPEMNCIGHVWSRTKVAVAGRTRLLTHAEVPKEIEPRYRSHWDQYGMQE